MLMSHRLSLTRCVRCQSYQVVEGHITARDCNVWFTPNHLKGRHILSFSGVPTAQILATGDTTFACLQCGLLWKTQDENAIRQICETWGDETLKELMEKNRRLDAENDTSP